MQLTSTAFGHEGTIPEDHAKESGNASPALEWTGPPAGTRSFALIMDDPDAPKGLFTHWLVYGIPAEERGLPANLDPAPALPNGIRQGRNGFGDPGYGGPRPPSGTHRYFFHLYALDNVPNLPPNAARPDVDHALQGHILAEAALMGRYTHRD